MSARKNEIRPKETYDNPHIQRGNSFPKPMFLLILVTLLTSLALTACGLRTETGRVIAFGQAIPAGGGLVQSYVTVELDDGTEVYAWLPQDDSLWNTLQRGAASGNIRIKIRRDGEFWKFDQILEND
jgi:hypothetical protein